MAPAIMANPDRPELSQELTESFCRMDPNIAKQFARVTFFSDNRADLPAIKARTLILQCREDIIAPTSVGVRTSPVRGAERGPRRGLALPITIIHVGITFIHTLLTNAA